MDRNGLIDTRRFHDEIGGLKNKILLSSRHQGMVAGYFYG
jgi:hypothetical protein